MIMIIIVIIKIIVSHLKLSKSPPKGRLLLLWSKTCHNLKADAVLQTKTTQSHNLQDKHKCFYTVM